MSVCVSVCLNVSVCVFLCVCVIEMVMPPHPLTPKSPYHPKGGLIGIYILLAGWGGPRPHTYGGGPFFDI